MAQIEAADSGRENLAERALSVLADVRAGEGAGVLLLGLDVFLLLVSYYLLKTVREPLILTQGGPRSRPIRPRSRLCFCWAC